MKKIYRSKKLASFLVALQITLLLLFSTSAFAATPASNGTLLDEFDSIGAWKVVDGCKIAIDSSNKVSGNSSMKMTSAVAAGGGEFNVEGPLPSKKDLSTLKNVEINFYAGDLSTLNTVALFIMTDDGNFYYNYIGTWEMMKGWNKIRRTISNFDKYGNPSLANINKLWVKVEAAAGKKPVINMDKISYNVDGQTNILFTFDDGSSGVYNYAYPIMKAKGMVGTTWAVKDLSTSEDPAFMSPATLQKLYAAGWDVSNHTLNHPDDITILPLAQKIKEYKDNMTWLNSLGFTRSSAHACFPMGSFDAQLLSLLPTIGVKSARSTIHGVQAAPVEDIYRLKCVAVGRDTDINFVKDVINTAVATGSSVFFMFHDAAPSPNMTNPDDAIVISSAKLSEIVNYVNNLKVAGKVKVPTISQWYNEYTGTGTGTSNVATVYEHINYGGKSLALAPGKYNMADLERAGILNDTISSVKVNSGYSVVGYQDISFGGKKWIIAKDTSSLLTLGANDIFSSIEVVKTSSLFLPITGLIPNSATLISGAIDTNTNSSSTSSQGGSCSSSTQVNQSGSGTTTITSNILSSFEEMTSSTETTTTVVFNYQINQ